LQLDSDCAEKLINIVAQVADAFVNYKQLANCNSLLVQSFPEGVAAK